jgi:hypothetical protein
MRVLLFLFAVLSLFVPALGDAVSAAGSTTQNLEWSVVRVRFQFSDENGEAFEQNGTAVLASRWGWFATAAHLFYKSPSVSPSGRLSVAWPNGDISWAERYCYSTPYPDLGWFLVRPPPQGARPISISKRIPSRFGSVRVVGYPGQYPGTLDRRGRIVRIDPFLKVITFRLETKLEDWHGLSGGALLDEGGSLLGIVYATDEQMGRGYAVLMVGQTWCKQ